MEGNTALHLAAENGHENVVKLLLDKGADINIIDNTGATSLHLATLHEHANTVEFLQKEANPNMQDKHKHTALHYAGIIELLLKQKANPDIQNNHEDTVLFLVNKNEYNNKYIKKINFKEHNKTQY